MGDDTAFLEGRPPLPPHPDDWRPEVMGCVGPAARMVWLMHEPPTGTPLSAEGSIVGGNPEWREAIERYAPLLVICGHDHRTPIRKKRWHALLERTTCVNVGQAEGAGLRFGLVKAQFDGGRGILPTSLEITAFPVRESVTIPHES